MYETFYEFSEKPFQITPDPAFIYSSRGHKRAASYLQYGLHKGEGFIVITGEVGAGKTTLATGMLAQLDTNAIVPAHIESTQLNPEQLLRELANQFELNTAGLDKAALLGKLREFLSDLHKKDQRALLLIDEAQNLSVESIEEIRMLTNYTVGKRSAIQVFLIGQPELRHVMGSPQLSQFRQRTVASYHLGPLDEAETKAYVEHRLRHVGWDGRPLIGEGVIGQVYRHTGGIPRRINTVFDQLLVAGFLEESNELTDDMATEVIRETGSDGSLDSQDHTAGAYNGLNGNTHLAGTLSQTHALASAVRDTGLHQPAGGLSNGGVNGGSLQDIDMRISALEASNVLVVQTLRRLLGEIERMSNKQA